MLTKKGQQEEDASAVPSSNGKFHAVYGRVQDELRATMMDVYLHTEFQHLLETT